MVETCPEIEALIRDELNSDEEDEEYQPCEDEIASDDDTNTTISDIDSQPRTPATPYCVTDFDDNSRTPKYTNDGLFKIPAEVGSSGLTEEQEIIAQRTRSKVCLQETAIETIEATFVPPDITTDMYDFENDLDNEWAEFLKEFTMPLNNVEHEADDDEADPEFIAPEHDLIMCKFFLI